MSKKNNHQREFELKLDRLENDQAIMSDNDGQKFIIPKTCAAHLGSDEKMILTIESTEENARRKNATAKDILNEILHS